ncbi:MAG: hypothetical protein JNM00_07900 [Flavobacteriales bacterium]|nr:hypothetical protein [Flavobacteriales bacterium]
METSPTFVQKSLTETRTYSIGEEGVNVMRRTAFDRTEFMVRYERIGYDIVWKYQRFQQWPQMLYIPLVLIGVFALLMSIQSQPGGAMAVVGIFLILAFGMASLHSYFSRVPHKVFITGNAEGLQEIELLADKPDRAQVEAFIAEIHNAARAYLRQRYFKPDPYLHPEMQRNKFEWLLSAKAITEEEMFEMLKKLRAGGDDRNIGFMGKVGF